MEDLHGDCILNVLVIYDDRNSALRAKAVLDNLFNTFCAEFSFHCDLWRLDVLELPAVQEQALDSGRTADLIIIAARDCAEISMSLKTWLFEWIAQKTEGTAALVGLFERCDSAHSFQKQVRSFLRPLEQRVDFLFFEGPPDEADGKAQPGARSDFKRTGFDDAPEP